MRVYQIIKNCTISFRENDNTANDFCLYKDDIIFIEDIGWIQIGKSYIKSCRLSKIYYKKVDLKGGYKWTWINDINVIDPLINNGGKNYNINYHIAETIIDITDSWNRNEKINSIIN